MRLSAAGTFFLALLGFASLGAAAPSHPNPKRVELSGGVIAIRDNDGVKIERRGSPAKVLWKGDGQLRGDPGERQGEVARFEDLNGDGLPELVIGTVYEPVRLCGTSQLPLLFRRAYDPAGDALRPIAARRILPFPPTSTLKARPGEAIKGPSLAMPEAVSSIAGSPHELWSLLGPFGIADGNPRTAWIIGSSDGRGEFATFRLPQGPYGVVRIGVRAQLPPDRKSPGRYDRPKSLLLALADRTYRLEFDADSSVQPAQTVWFDLPAPVATECASLLVETTFEPGQGHPLALADIAVLTQADGDEALPGLARDLASKERRRAAAAILERRGPKAAAAVSQIFDSLDSPGRTAALRVLAATDPVSAMPRLVDAALGDDEAQKRAGLAGLAESPQAATQELGRRLADADASKALQAIEAISQLPAPMAATALLSRSGAGPRRFRSALRSALRRAAARSSQAALQLASALQPFPPADEGAVEKALDVLRAAAVESSLRDLVVRKILELSKADSTFGTQYRLMEVAQSLGCDAPPAALRRAAAHVEAAVRARAVEAAAACEKAELSRELGLAAVQDRDVAVRLAGWSALSERSTGGGELGADLPTRLRGEPWPAVRVRIVRAASPGNPQAQLVLTAAVADTSPLVRIAALETLVNHRAAFADALVAERLSDASEALPVRAAAAKAAGRRGQVSAAQALFDLLRQGAQPMASRPEIEAAVAAAMALGALCTDEARALLRRAARRSNAVTERAITAALARGARECQVSAASNR
ncbi:MAG: hypothetical protein MUC50_09155 [Myxococcota bacterium]|jgi:hypothetical protein|nr:hypothetical protein [Myxococcota bacterium]